MGLELLALACAYAIMQAWEQGWGYARRGAGAAAGRARQAASARAAKARESKNPRVQRAMALGHGAAVGARGLWRASAGLARAMRAGWDAGWARGVEKGRERQEKRRARKEEQRRERAKAQGICPDCEHPYQEGRVEGCGCTHEECPCSVKPVQRGEGDTEPEPEPGGNDQATGEADRAADASEPAVVAPGEVVVGPRDEQIPPSEWEETEEITVRRTRRGTAPVQVPAGDAQPAAVIDAEPVALDKFAGYRHGDAAGILAPRAAVEAPQASDLPISVYTPAGLPLAPEPQDGESPEDYVTRTRAAGYQMTQLGPRTFSVTGHTPPSTTNPTGGEMPVLGDGTTIGRTRMALRGFAADALRFLTVSDEAKEGAARVQHESAPLVAAAERLASNMAAAEVDAESVGEVNRIKEAAAAVTAAVAKVAAAAGGVGTFADTLSSESRASLAKLNAGHQQLENARREAPNNGAVKRWYQPA